MAMPAWAELDVPVHWQAIDFISDLHLGPATPRTFEAWARYLRHTQADAVYMLGDVFEVWVGDDAVDESGSFEQQCAEVMRDVASRRTVGFMAGNRDFLLGKPLLDRLGVQSLPDPLLLRAFGQSLLVTHGDLLCIADTAYQGFRQQVRSTAWQSAFLARPLAERRALAQQMRDASRDAQRQLPPSMWSDVDDAEASLWLRQADSPTLLHGHTHKPAMHTLAQGCRLVLSDWDFDVPPPRGDLIRWTLAGLSRHAVAAAAP